MVNNKKVLITEATQAFVENELDEKLDDMSEEEVLAKVNSSKSAVAKLNEEGLVTVKQVLKG